MRQHQNMLATQTALNRLWHSANGEVARQNSFGDEQRSMVSRHLVKRLDLQYTVCIYYIIYIYIYLQVLGFNSVAGRACFQGSPVGGLLLGWPLHAHVPETGLVVANPERWKSSESVWPLYSTWINSMLMLPLLVLFVSNRTLSHIKFGPRLSWVVLSCSTGKAKTLITEILWNSNLGPLCYRKILQTLYPGDSVQRIACFVACGARTHD